MRNTRTRRTSNKLAAYKAAASRESSRAGCKVGSSPGSIRVSPRRKGASNHSASTVLSPSQSSRADDSEVKKTSDIPFGTKKNTKHSGLEASQVQTSATKAFESLEEIPETPPRCTSRTGIANRNKRVHPLHRKASLPDSDNDSEKPSKKRKIFKTPPRALGKENETRGTDRSVKPRGMQNARSPGVGNVLHRVSCGDESEVPGTDDEEGFGRVLETSDRSMLKARANHWSSPDVGVQRTFPERTGFAEGSAMRVDELDVLRLSSATLSRMLDGYWKKVTSEMESLQRKNLNEMRKIADDVLSAVTGELSHMEGVFTMMNRSMGGIRSTKAGAKTSLTEWEKKLNSLTPDIDIIFNREVLGTILCYNTPIQATVVYRKQDGSDVQKAVLSAQTLLFSLQPGDKKFSYSSKVGGLHSDFKFTVVQNAFFNVLRDTFKMFRIDNDPKDSRKSVSSENSETSLGTSRNSGESTVACKKIKRPSWLSEKVTKDHINDARNFLERPNQSRKSKVSRTPNPYDIACHGALRVYRLLGSYLHVRRGAVRTTFFQSIGYLLVPWHNFVKDVKQDALKLCWAADVDSSHDGTLSLNLGDVPYSEQCGFVADHSAVTSTDAKNKHLLRQLFADWPGMVLTVEHVVHVVNGNGVQRKHSGGNPATVHRLFNLIDVACDFCVEYCGAGSRENFLRSHKYAFQCIMIFALLFKAFCAEFMKQSRMQESSAASSNITGSRTFPEPSELQVEGLCLKDLIPGPSTQKNLLECRCLRMTESEFNMYNHTPNEEHDVSGDGGDDGCVIGMMEIEESEELGIGAL